MDPIQSVKPKNSRTLMVDFNLKSGASQYIIRVQNGNSFFREDRVSSSPAEIQSLVPYTEYTLSIMAVNSGGRSQPSAPVTAKTGMLVFLLSDKRNTPGQSFISKMSHIVTRKQRGFMPSVNMSCRSHPICCIVCWFCHNLNPVSGFGQMQVCLASGPPLGPFYLLYLTMTVTLTLG